MPFYTLSDVVDETMTFKPDALRAARDLARSKPWEGDDADRLEKLKKAGNSLLAAYGIEPFEIDHVGGDIGDSVVTVSEEVRQIELSGKLSVVTLFIAIHKARQIVRRGTYSHLKAFKWAVNLFRRKFPVSFAGCRVDGGVFCRPAMVNNPPLPESPSSDDGDLHRVIEELAGNTTPDNPTTPTTA